MAKRVTLGSVKLEGFDELKEALAQLGRSLERGVLKRAGTRAMRPVVDSAKGLVPVRTGKLRDSIKISSKSIRDADYRQRARASFLSSGSAKGVRATKGAKSTMSVSVTAGGPGAKHAGFVEKGTVKMAARPYLRPAFDNNGNRMISELYDALGDEIDKAVKRRDKKLAKLAGE